MDAQTLSQRMRGASLVERLRLAVAAVDGKLVFTTSFGLEDQVLTHAIATAGVPIAVATLDTGRLFPETYEVWAQTEARYGLRIAVAMPRTGDLEALVQRQGIDGFRRSVMARHACCGVRKVEPLGRLLDGAAGWLTGLRAGQSQERALTPFAERDAAHGLLKINPLADFTRDDVERYVVERAVPYNPLHDRGFASIGCAPCTRAVKPGEPERSGRWWWEEEQKKECGLHVAPVAAARQEEHA